MRRCLFLASTALLAVPLSAQDILATHVPAPGETFLAAVGVGDVDHDGLSDYALSVQSGPTVEVRVYSGATHQVHYTIARPSGMMLWGIDLAAADLTADGVPEIIVQGSNGVHSACSVHDGTNGTLLYQALDLFFVRGGGDVNGDGFADLLTAEKIGQFPNLVDTFAVLSGRDGSVIHLHQEPTLSSSAISIAPGGDSNSDGFADFLITQTGHNAVQLLSGRDAGLLDTWVGAPGTAEFGSYMDDVGDQDGDGTQDLAVSGGSVVAIVSGASGAVIRYVPLAPHTVPIGMSCPGDLNWDGQDDIAVANFRSLTDTPVSSDLYSAATGNRIYVWYDTSRGVSHLHRLGDLTGDGRDEVLVFWQEDPVVTGAPALLEVRAGNDLWLESTPPLLVKANDRLKLKLTEGPNGAPTVLAVVGVQGTPLFLSLGVRTFDASGLRVDGFTVPPGLAGLSIDFLGAALVATRLHVSAVARVEFD